MITITSYDLAMKYILGLGFVNNKSPMASQQGDLCDLANLLCRAAGISGKWEKGITFQVHFHRYIHNGYHYPWLGHFIVVRQDGTMWKAYYDRFTHLPIIEQTWKGIQ